MRGWGYVPWDMPTLETALLRCSTEEERKMIAYYYSDEAAAAIAKAKKAKEIYFAQFPDIERFLKNIVAVAKRRGWVKTWTGRRRHFKRPKEEAYKAANACIQGGCGDITKKKMYEITMYLQEHGYKSRIVNSVHDSLLFEIHRDEMHITTELKRIMEDLPFSVPITTDAEMSEVSWADLS